MTIITKAIGEKKPSDKMEQPLVVDDIPEDQRKSCGGACDDPEAQRPPRGAGTAGPYLTIKDQVLILRRANLRPNSWTLYWLLFTAMVGMGIGVTGGLYIYRYYARDQMHRFRTGWYSIPYEGSTGAGSNRSPIDRDGLLAGELAHSLEAANYFKERFEIDLEKHYEEFDVPDSRGGRQGRIIHDFNNNLTGIIDTDGNCCFVMPLNRKRVLPPWSLLNPLNKMSDFYYEVNTKVVRETMRAVLPPLSNLTSVGAYIRKECKHMPTYLLEKVTYTGGIIKRSASNAYYGRFSGNSIDEWEIVNLDQVLGHTKK
ncbi:integral membrane protein 2B [Venturia canescens]|uniref:integral membrane protein 2B n=1 Tax=Venturia canescens TaxID=32260 RepID=UPI001C9CF26B|nr:integral membrane protein 2B [Venturia canescens]